MKSKLENGEVNLEKELQKLSKHWIGDIMCDQWIEQVEELFTNALNQQREELTIFTEDELRVMKIDYESLIRVGELMSRKVKGSKILEFQLDADDSVRKDILTKLEEEK